MSNGPLRTSGIVRTTNLLPSVSPTVSDDRTTNGTVPHIVPLYVWILGGAFGCFVIILCIFGVVALKVTFVFLKCGHSSGMDPVQAEDNGPSKVVLLMNSFPIRERDGDSPPPLFHIDDASINSDANDNDDVHDRPEQRVSSPEPDELALPGEIRLLRKPVDT
jgi:hypothetical protein